jgi:hypothetical protein
MWERVLGRQFYLCFKTFYLRFLVSNFFFLWCWFAVATKSVFIIVIRLFEPTAKMLALTPKVPDA